MIARILCWIHGHKINRGYDAYSIPFDWCPRCRRVLSPIYPK